MSDYLAAIQRLEEEAAAAGYGPGQVNLTEEAVRLADTHGDVDEGFRLRKALMKAAAFGGRPDLLFVAFSWCLARHDEQPARFGPVGALLWEYKWVVNALLGFPQVPRAQVEAAFADMEARFARAGSTMHAVHHKRRNLMIHVGDRAGAAAAHERMTRAPRDYLSDCLACAHDETVKYLLWQGEDAEAVRHAELILRGRMTCAEVPARTYGRMLAPLLRLGRADEAMAYHRRSYPKIAANPALLNTAALHLIFLCQTDNLARATKLLERHLPQALAAPGALDRFNFFRAGTVVLERLAESGTAEVRLRLPAGFAAEAAKGRYAVADLARRFREEMRLLADQFDARNGTSAFHDRIAEIAGLKQVITPCAFSTRVTGDPP